MDLLPTSGAPAAPTPQAESSAQAGLAEAVQQAPRQINALLLDGGGVRGLASLLILKDFMRILNNIPRQKLQNEQLEPHHVFDLVAGTSTVGLIAIMLGKFGMSIRECIYAYRALSGDIFSKKSLRGRMSFGLWKAKYRGEKLRDNVVNLLSYSDLSEDLPMLRRSEDPQDKIPCAVVCNEHKTRHKFGKLKDTPMRFCSTECTEQQGIPCLVCDAAHATAAAMTYFDMVPIGGRWFSDGGVKYNNPSETILEHYLQEERTRITVTNYRRASAVSVGVERHAGLHLNDRVMMLNIGTGSKTEATPEPPSRHRLKDLLTPSILSNAKGLGSTLIRAATASEDVANTMKLMARTSSGRVKYDRLSPNNEVCWFKLDRYDKLQEIGEYTNQWLQGVQGEMTAIARGIVEERFGLGDEEISPPVQSVDEPNLGISLA